ncbi:hypothetical protein CMT41_10665 [Colwellia sp. MT41]|uniref:hypothetical protein n=1 Tax=Colwellia sp. MT41 TaxID=58049 RepID=UPI0007179675|nr:hypothetical protein [Colwellia sp. MT41]ALO35130.1 hypothetical protein CMT41_10665 [Colwellia sp. MT41]
MEKIYHNDSWLTVRLTPWDEKVMGIGTCDVIEFHSSCFNDTYSLLRKLDGWCLRNEISFIQIRVNGNDKISKKALTETGYYFAETSMKLSLMKPANKNISSLDRFSLELVKACEGDLQGFKDIARNDFHHGRLIEDCYVEECKAKNRNENWIDDLAKAPFSLFKGVFRGQNVGFHAEYLNEKENTVSWILTGVSSDYSMFALPLWTAAFKRAQYLNVDKITTMVSSSNTKVLNLYNKFSFNIDECLLGYHKKIAL